jgi:acylphosphatase
MAATRRVHLKISGSVQGVSFRWYGRSRAQSLGLTGWIRNCSDGSVEAVVQGPADAVARFIEWSRRGPSLAGVDRVDAREEEPEHGSQTFLIRD